MWFCSLYFLFALFTFIFCIANNVGRNRFLRMDTAVSLEGLLSQVWRTDGTLHHPLPVEITQEPFPCRPTESVSHENLWALMERFLCHPIPGSSIPWQNIPVTIAFNQIFPWQDFPNTCLSDRFFKYEMSSSPGPNGLIIETYLYSLCILCLFQIYIFILFFLCSHDT